MTPSKLVDVKEAGMSKAEGSAASSRTSQNPFSSLLSKITRTPKHKISILPTHEEMHPSYHQQSTTKPLDEARWLGFMPMTEPAKKPQSNTNDHTGASAVPQATPTRATQSAKAEAFYTPPAELKLSSKRKASFDAELSPEAQRIMAETREEAVKIRAKMTAAKERQEAQDQHAEQQPIFGLTNAIGARKIAKPRGRFSDAHKKAFGSMDSIANHPSAFRANPTHGAAPIPLDDNSSTKQLKRTHSKADLGTPQKSSLPVKTAFTPIPPRDPALLSPVKRLKTAVDTDPSVARSAPRGKASFQDLTKPGSVPSTTKVPIKTGIPLLPSNLSTPTKASLARTQSAKSLRHKSSIPTFTKSPSLKDLEKAASPALPPASPATTNTPAESHSLSKLAKSPSIRSILRAGPTLLYSDDPAKIAAGTHIKTPTHKSLLPRIPATAPVKKQVDFTESTKERELSQLLSSPSSVSAAGSSEDVKPAKAETADVTYPSIPNSPVSQQTNLVPVSRPIAVPKSKVNRRQTVNPAVSAITPTGGNFTFRSGTAPSFTAPTAASTIRRVRNSDAVTPLAAVPSDRITVSKKRKLENVTEDSESSDKENERSVHLVETERPAKKSKTSEQKKEPKKQAGTAAQRVERKGPMMRLPSPSKAAASPKKGGLTMARLNMLAMPKSKRT